MTSSKSKYSISAAARIADKSRTTIASHIKSGKLSMMASANGNRSIDASELIRVYGDECDFDRATGASKPASKTKQHQVTSAEQRASSESHTVQQLLESERKERDREREQLQARIDHLEDSLKRSQEGHNRATLLLEDRTGGVGDLEKSFRMLEERIAKQELADVKEMATRKVIEETRDKPWWRVVFGSNGQERRAV